MALLAACRIGRKEAPSIVASSLQTRSGAAVSVSGEHWRPGEHVVIGFSQPRAPARDSTTLATVLADASGAFVALFPLPQDEQWAALNEVWVVAHTRSYDQVATTSLAYPQRPAPTLVIASTPLATARIEPGGYVLGYVEEVAASARLIMIRPIEGQARVIALVDITQLLLAGRPVQLSDIRVGDLVEANGQLGADNSVIASQIRLLVQSTPQPTPTLPPPGPALVWKGEYYANTTFSGNPFLVRDDPVVDFQWDGGTPADGLPADYFAVRWTGTWPFETGNYRFYTQVDDGVRLWLDEHLMIDQWHESNGAVYSADAFLMAGSHMVRAEYFEGRAAAQARLWWEQRDLTAAQAYPDWKGEYFANMDLGGTPFLVLNERTINFDWGLGPAASGMPADNFSARWSRTLQLAEGIYRFFARADDGVRVWVDGEPVINVWRDGPVETHYGERFLAQGSHTIRVEYYENGGYAVIQVGWEIAPATPTPMPTATSSPTTTPTQTAPPPTPLPSDTPGLVPGTPIIIPGFTPPALRPPLAIGSAVGLYFPVAGAQPLAQRLVRKARRARAPGPAAGW